MTTAIIAIVVAAMLAAAFRLWLTANRLDRLHVRTEAAWAVCEQALARRIVAARALAATGQLAADRARRLRDAADSADASPGPGREAAEQRLAQQLATISADERGDLAAELADADERIVLARQFYNDAVRDTRALRASWFTRFFRLAGHALLPEYFDAPVGDSPPGG